MERPRPMQSRWGFSKRPLSRITSNGWRESRAEILITSCISTLAWIGQIAKELSSKTAINGWFWDQDDEYLFPKGSFFFLHGSFIIKGYFSARSGGTHQGINSNAFEKVDDAHVSIGFNKSTSFPPSWVGSSVGSCCRWNKKTHCGGLNFMATNLISAGPNPAFKNPT